MAHAGDLLSRVIRGLRGDPSHLEYVKRSLRTFADKEFDGARTWVATYGPSEGTFWWQRDVNPNDPLFDPAVVWYRDALRDHGLRWLVSMGDVSMLISPLSQRMEFARRVARLIGDLDMVLGVDGGNEAWQTGEPDENRLRQIAGAFRDVLPCAVWSCTSAPSEEKADMDRYAGSVFDKHGSRGGIYIDMVRHIFSILAEQTPNKWLGIDSEWAGYGRNVSATNDSGMRSLSNGAIEMGIVQMLMSRQLPVWMSSAGVISDGYVQRVDSRTFRPVFDGGEEFADQRGVNCAVIARKLLPMDLMSWPTHCHGGTRWAGTRVRAVPGTDNTRADQTISADGRVCSLEYGGRFRDVFSEKSLNIEIEHYFPDNAGRFIYGRR